ncbi:hypothetical protein BXZ70DRAFT_1067063 [Cristinia sonorae]|uniref:Serine protease inhibitor n=1 Tax=Cristinia sonorae TaxID=1940300 RepID=A0A8K0UHT3_9AGAR|nr:hypothetical protein BXZ70DRAFT_1067063 [Cristinia sonorae]
MSVNTLTPGLYFIQSVATDRFIARPQNEDKSLLPKAVVQLPAGQKPESAWVVESLPGADDNSYILRIGGAPTAKVDDRLFAILIDGEPNPEVWKVTHPERNASNEFIVETNNSEAGWVIQDNSEDNDQILVKPLIVGKSFPPFYPPTEVFKFTPVHE